MLQIKIPAFEAYDSINNLFINVGEQNLNLEHSLLSISKWEAKFCKPFLNSESLTDFEINYYIQCMVINQNVDPLVFMHIPKEVYDEIADYIKSPMTATRINDFNDKPKKKEIITSELIYYWMITYNIPVEFQKWHINRLLTLIKVCDIKNAPQKKMGRNEILNRNRSLNEARKKALHSKG